MTAEVVHLDTRRKAPCTCPAHRLDALLVRAAAHLEADDALLVPRSLVEAIVADISTTIVSVDAPRCPGTNHKRRRP